MRYFSNQWGETPVRVTYLVLIGLFAVIAVTRPTSRAAAYQSQAIGVEIFAGLDGFCREGDWFPIRVVLENTGANLAGEIHIKSPQAGDLGSVYAGPFSAPSGSRKTISILAFAGGFFSELEAHLVVNGQTISITPFPLTCLPPQDILFGVIAEQTTPFNVLIDLDPPVGAAHIAQLSLADITASPFALEPLDAVIISGVETSSLTDNQLTAIAGWVAGGGDLMLTGGPGWDKTLPVFRDLMPFEPTGTTRIPALEEFAAAFGIDQELREESFLTTGDLRPEGEIIAQVDDAPVLIRGASGDGTVSVLMVDPTLAPLRNWGGMIEVYREVFSPSQERNGWSSGFISWEFAREAVSIIPGLDLPPFAWICGLLFIYILVIGPVNYWLLRRWNRREFAWISIPLLVVVFTILTYTVGRTTRGNLPIINRLAVVQSWPDTGFARVDALFGVFSPDRATYSLEIKDNFIPFAIPRNFQTGPDLHTFIQSPNMTSIPTVQVEIGGIKAFGANGQIPATQVQSDLLIDLAPGGARMTGTFTLPPDLTLTDAVLLAPGTFRGLGDLDNGETVDVDLGLNSARASQASGLGPAYSPNLSTVEEIIGSSYYAAFNDPKTSAKIGLLNALMDPYGSRIDRGFGVFLIGWAEEPILPVELIEENFETLDLTAHIIALPTSINFLPGEPVTIPPGLFHWELLDFNYNRPVGPYNMYLDLGGEMQMKYNLDASVRFSEVAGLSLHLDGDQSPSNLPTISLWDFSTESWEAISANWGRTEVSNFHRFVTDQGEIRVRAENSAGQSGMYINRLDVSLTIIP